MATRKMAEGMVTKQQIKKIHALKGAMGLDDDTYRGALYHAFGVDSSKELSFSEAEEVLRFFEREAVSMGVWEQRNKEQKRHALKNRSGYATPAQLGFIEALWSDVSRAEGARERAKALRNFLLRQAEVSDLRFLRAADANKVICALKGMKKQKKVSGKERKKGY
jgi:hypothetical protein